jgi:hypothetical protein
VRDGGSMRHERRMHTSSAWGSGSGAPPRPGRFRRHQRRRRAGASFGFLPGPAYSAGTGLAAAGAAGSLACWWTMVTCIGWGLADAAVTMPQIHMARQSGPPIIKPKNGTKRLSKTPKSQRRSWTPRFTSPAFRRRDSLP